MNINEKIQNLVNNLVIPNDAKYQRPEVENALMMLLDHNSSVSWVTLFEKSFAQRMGVKHAIACNSGTSGLHAALHAAGVGPGDEVLVPALTVIMDAYTILHLGATPIFVDVDEGTHLLDVDDMKQKITSNTKVVLTVSWEGISCDMDPIIREAKARNIIVIDDSARNVLGTYKGRLTGTVADMTVFSLESKKHLTAGSEGGVVVSNDPNLAMRARKFAGIGYKHLTADAGRTHLAIDTVQDPDYRRFDLMGLNYRMNDISAAIALGQLERVDEIIGMRKAVGKLFQERTAGFDWFLPQYCPPHTEHSYYTFSVDYREDVTGLPWKSFYREYKARGGDGFYGVVAIPYLEPSLIGREIGGQILNYGLCKVAEGLQKRVMCFKTNYRDIKVAEEKIEKLRDLLEDISKRKVSV